MFFDEDHPTSSKRSLIRYLATTFRPRSLLPSTRRAAARDPGLEWDAQHGTYRRVRKGAPAPSSPTGASAEGAGGPESSEVHVFQTGGGPRKVRKDSEMEGNDHG